LSFLPNIVILFKLFKELQFTNTNYIAPKASHTQRVRKMATGGGHISELYKKPLKTASVKKSLP
jgi:hypothetical protein